MGQWLVKAKARRRIRRFIKTGQHQARVYSTDIYNVYEYKTKHYVSSMFFRKTWYGTLKLMV